MTVCQLCGTGHCGCTSWPWFVHREEAWTREASVGSRTDLVNILALRAGWGYIRCLSELLNGRCQQWALLFYVYVSVCVCVCTNYGYTARSLCPWADGKCCVCVEGGNGFPAVPCASKIETFKDQCSTRFPCGCTVYHIGGIQAPLLSVAQHGGERAYIYLLANCLSKKHSTLHILGYRAIHLLNINLRCSSHRHTLTETHRDSCLYR